MTKENIFVSEQGNKYTFKKLPDGKLWIDGYLREKVDCAVWNEKYNCYMYTWDQAKEAVPEGMRLPTARDFMELCLALGYLEDGNKDVAQRLVNECGFTMAGCAEDSSSLNYQGRYSVVWSSTPYPDTDDNDVYILYADSSEVNPMDYDNRFSRFSVRCIKD